MAPLPPLWWLKEVPIRLETFVNAHHSIRQTVTRPRGVAPYSDGTARQHGNQGGVFALPNQFAKSIVWRTKENATVLELISLSGKDNTPTSPISFHFHAPILAGIHFAPWTQQEGVSVTLMTVDSVVYRLLIKDLAQFSSKDPPKYSSAQQVKWTTHCTPIAIKYLGDRQAAVASLDGSLFLIKSPLLAEDSNLSGTVDMESFLLLPKCTLSAYTSQWLTR
jgi:hypothetical protein